MNKDDFSDLVWDIIKTKAVQEFVKDCEKHDVYLVELVLQSFGLIIWDKVQEKRRKER